jgi:D-alanyl-D-alanine carboxypeptidase
VFPELRQSARGDYRSVTLRDLLQHRGGIQSRSGYFLPGSRFAGDAHERRYDYTRWLLGRRPEAIPHAEYHYSNAGYAIAGAMAERATGHPLEALFRERLFEPLGLTSASFDPAEWQYPNEPAGHVLLFGGPRRVGAGFLFGGRADAASGSGQRSHERQRPCAFCAASPARAARRADAARSCHHEAAPHPRGNYALGWGIEDDGRDVISWHSGTDGRSKGYIALRPKADLGIVVLRNVDGARAEEAYLQIEAALLMRHR